MLPAVQHEAELEKDEVPCGRRRLSRLHPHLQRLPTSLWLLCGGGGEKSFTRRALTFFFYLACEFHGVLVCVCMWGLSPPPLPPRLHLDDWQSELLSFHLISTHSLLFFSIFVLWSLLMPLTLLNVWCKSVTLEFIFIQIYIFFVSFPLLFFNPLSFVLMFSNSVHMQYYSWCNVDGYLYRSLFFFFLHFYVWTFVKKKKKKMLSQSVCKMYVWIKLTNLNLWFTFIQWTEGNERALLYLKLESILVSLWSRTWATFIIPLLWSTRGQTKSKQNNSSLAA